MIIFVYWEKALAALLIIMKEPLYMKKILKMESFGSWNIYGNGSIRSY